jgi:hypothetical protein
LNPETPKFGPGQVRRRVRRYPPGTQITLACTRTVPQGRSNGADDLVKNASPF